MGRRVGAAACGVKTGHICSGMWLKCLWVSMHVEMLVDETEMVSLYLDPKHHEYFAEKIKFHQVRNKDHSTALVLL